MLYAIFGNDVPDSLERRKVARPAHLARLQALQDEGRLLLAGPFPAVDAVDPGLAVVVLDPGGPALEAPGALGTGDEHDLIGQTDRTLDHDDLLVHPIREGRGAGG